MDFNIAMAILGVVGSGGVAVGVAKTTFNGSKEKLNGIAKDLKEHVEHDHAIQLDAVQRLTRIETKLDTMCAAVIQDED
jgi:hypothetical protein